MEKEERSGLSGILKRLNILPDAPEDDPEDDLDEELVETELRQEEKEKKKPSRKKVLNAAAARQEGKEPLRVRIYWRLQDIKELMSDHLRLVLITVGVVAVVLFFFLYNRSMTFDGYRVASSYENLATAGTYYLDAGKYLFKYNGDGISCVSRSNETKWSTTYSIQAPIADICGKTMAVAEQQGMNVYVVNTDGELGHFETPSPILKVRVSRQGLAAVVLQEDEVTWVNLYQSDGTLVASDKTTIMESGYPADIALSPDGERVAVSYVKLDGGVFSDNVVFYHFGQAGQNRENHIAASFTYEETMIPELYFVDNSQAVALTDDGFIVYSGKDRPKESDRKTFEEEIISAFHDGKSVGYVFRNDPEKEEKPYRIELYNLSGRQTSETSVDCDYDRIRMQNGQILLFNDHSITAVTAAGHERFHSEYNKTVNEVFYFKEYRKYLVITSDSFDKIRIEAKQ